MQGKNPFDAPGMQLPDPYAHLPPAETFLEHLAEYVGVFAGSSASPEVWFAVAILVWRGRDLERFTLWLFVLSTLLMFAQGYLLEVVLKSPNPYPPGYNLVRLFFVLLIWGVIGAMLARLAMKVSLGLSSPSPPR